MPVRGRNGETGAKVSCTLFRNSHFSNGGTMTTTRKGSTVAAAPQTPISRPRLRAEIVAALAIVFLLGTVATQRAEAQTYTVLHSFAYLDGALTVAPLLMDPAGNLYGTTIYGGDSDYGTVFKLDTSGN